MFGLPAGAWRLRSALFPFRMGEEHARSYVELWKRAGERGVLPTDPELRSGQQRGVR